MVQIIAVAVMVAHHQGGNLLLAQRAEVIIGCRLVGKGGAIAPRGHVKGMQNRASRGNGKVGIISMEVGSGVCQASRPTVFDDIGENQHARILRVMKSVDHVGRGLAPILGKAHQLGGRERLLLEHNKTVLVQSIAEPQLLLGAQRFGRIKPVYAGTHNMTQAGGSKHGVN